MSRLQPSDRTPFKCLDLILRLRNASTTHLAATPTGLQIMTVDYNGKLCKTLPKEEFLGKPKGNKGDKSKDTEEFEGFQILCLSFGHVTSKLMEHFSLPFTSWSFRTNFHHFFKKHMWIQGFLKCTTEVHKSLLSKAGLGSSWSVLLVSMRLPETCILMLLIA